eukprot:s572_g27.t1
MVLQTADELVSNTGSKRDAVRRLQANFGISCSMAKGLLQPGKRAKAEQFVETTPQGREGLGKSSSQYEEANHLDRLEKRVAAREGRGEGRQSGTEEKARLEVCWRLWDQALQAAADPAGSQLAAARAMHNQMEPGGKDSLEERSALRHCCQRNSICKTWQSTRKEGSPSRNLCAAQQRRLSNRTARLAASTARGHPAEKQLPEAVLSELQAAPDVARPMLLLALLHFPRHYSLLALERQADKQLAFRLQDSVRSEAAVNRLNRWIVALLRTRQNTKMAEATKQDAAAAMQPHQAAAPAAPAAAAAAAAAAKAAAKPVFGCSRLELASLRALQAGRLLNLADILRHHCQATCSRRAAPSSMADSQNAVQVPSQADTLGGAEARLASARKTAKQPLKAKVLSQLLQAVNSQTDVLGQHTEILLDVQENLFN